MSGCKLWLALCLLIAVSNAQSSSPTEETLCSVKSSCGECISASSECVWCADPDLGSNPVAAAASGTRGWVTGRSRCFLRSARNASLSCRNVMTGEAEVKVIKDEKLSESSESTNERISLRPQYAQVHIRANNSAKLRFTYKQNVDYPLDMYFLMDLSNTMKAHKEKLASIASQLSAKMSSITSNYAFGFGSFVEKAIPPFSDSTPDRKEKPCPRCVPTYAFKHHMRLGFDAERFARQVRESKHSGNLDGPEAGFDALMQSLVCNQTIGWRANATKIILFATDGQYHIANDGRLAGLLRPNDEKCHLDSNNEFSLADRFDYPSISQISQKAQENNVHIIFAVTSYVYETYNTLSPYILLSRVAKLEADSSNIMDLITSNYRDIRAEVRITDNGADEHLTTKYRSMCRPPGSSLFEEGTKVWTEGSVCGNVQPGQDVEFEVEIGTEVCRKDATSGKETRITISGANAASTLIVDVRVDCDCDCSRDAVLMSDSCNSRGNLTCGACVCEDGFGGEKCECDATSLRTGSEDKPCYGDDEKLCSGRGSCVCGSCQCNDPENVYGSLCQCDRTSCPREEGKLCSGNGICDCGTCRCSEGFTGETCACSTSVDSCRPPASLSYASDSSSDTEQGQVCSGRGTCECGECVCQGDHYGQWCQECPTCDGKCSFLSQRVRRERMTFAEHEASHNDSTLTYNSENRVKRQEDENSDDEDEEADGNDDEEKNDETNTAKPAVDVSAVDSKTPDFGTVEFADILSVRGDEKLCSYFEESGCSVYFTYNVTTARGRGSGRGKESTPPPADDRFLRLRIGKKVSCPEPISPIRVSIQTGFSVLLALLVILAVYKAMTWYQDRQEYSKFLKEVSAPTFRTKGQNPMYKPSVSEFANPAFTAGGNAVRT